MLATIQWVKIPGVAVQLCEGKATDKAIRFQVEVMAGGLSRLPLS